MKDLYPIFTSHYSIGRSLLVTELFTDKESKPITTIDLNSPVSIFNLSIAEKIDDIYLVDNNLSGFISAYKSAGQCGKNFRFGLRLVVCADLTVKDEDSFRTESKVILWALNIEGYKDLMRIYSKAATDGFYYIPRTDWKTLNEQLTENVQISIPFYDSFLHNNLLKDGAVIPLFLKCQPVFNIEDHNLPFDYLIKEAIINYAKNNNYKTINTHQIYYYKSDDSLAYQVFRCIDNRTNINKPNLEHFGSREFSFESYLERAK